MSKVQKLNEAIKTNNFNDIATALKLHDNPQTMVSYFYKVKNKMSDKIRDEIYNSLIKQHIPERKQLSLNRETKNIEISYDNIISIIENKNKSDIDTLIYQLLNTGRRLKEIVNADIEIRQGKLYVRLSKEKKEFEPYLLDKDIENTYNDIKNIQGKFNDNSISTQISRKLKKMNLTAHNLRDVYISLIHKFRNLDNLIMTNIANKYLGHNSNSSDQFYTKIIYNGPDPFSVDLKSKTVKELKAMAKKLKIVGYSKLRKEELIKILS